MNRRDFIWSTSVAFAGLTMSKAEAIVGPTDSFRRLAQVRSDDCSRSPEAGRRNQSLVTHSARSRTLRFRGRYQTSTVLMQNGRRQQSAGFGHRGRNISLPE